MRRPHRRLLLVLLPLLAAGTARAEAPLRSKLMSTDANEAYKGAEDAATSKDVGNAGALLEAGWQTIHPHIAVACGDALAAIGPSAAADSEYQRVLAKAVKSKDPRAQMNLARVLGAYGDPSVEEEMAFLASSRRASEVQAEALYMIGGLPISKEHPFAACVKEVATAITSKTGAVAMAACSAAARIKDPTFQDPLSEVARRSQHPYAGLYAVWALARMKAHPELGSFAHMLESEAKQETINACLRGVTDLTDASDTDALLSMTRATKKDYRDAACLALASVAERGGFSAPPVTSKPGDPPTATPAPTKVIDRLIQIVETDKDYEVREAAARVLIRIGDPARDAVTSKMPALCDSADRDVSLTAIELCGEFKAADAYKPLTKLAAYDKDPARRMLAARALGSINPQLAAEELLAAAQRDHKGKESTVNQLTALGYIRHETAFTGLVGMLSGTEWSEEILKTVERSLERLTGRRFGRDPEKWRVWYEKAKGAEPFHPHLGHYDRTKNRREAVAKRLYGLTETTERSVESGLRWLELQQHSEGYWDGNDRGMGGVVNCMPAYTGLSLLAFLGAGYDGVTGKYRETIRRAAEFLAATQFYDGSFPVTGGGDNSWIFAYVIGMGTWGVNEAYALSGSEILRGAAQRGIDYLARVQTPGAGWRYGPRYSQSDTSCTSWVLMTMKTASLTGLRVPAKAFDGIDSWLERCQFDITGEKELPEDMVTDYDKEVGAKRYFKAFTGYFTLSGKENSSLQQTSMTAVGMVCRFFMGWQRSHPFLIGSANYLKDYLPQWRKGLEKGQAIAWYFYFWYYGTLAMHQMGGSYWRAWNEKIKTMLPENQRNDPPALAGSWDPDSAVLNGGRIFSTAMAVMTLETYYRFSPLMLPSDDDKKGRKAAPGGPGMDGAGMDGGGMGEPAMDGAGMDAPPPDAPMDK